MEHVCEYLRPSIQPGSTFQSSVLENSGGQLRLLQSSTVAIDLYICGTKRTITLPKADENGLGDNIIIG